MYFDLNPGYKTNVKEISRCDMKLMKKLDYEARSAFIVQIVAEVSSLKYARMIENVRGHS